MEVWKPVTHNSKYEVSNLGRVRNTKSGTVMKPQRSVSKRREDKGYAQYAKIGLYENGTQKNYYVHRLVAIAFIDNPENKPQVDHINMDCVDNRVVNLRWCTSQENHIFRKEINDANK